MTGIFLHLKQIVDLVDRCYEREAPLTAFCKAVFASQEAATGPTPDRKLSTMASPTFSEVLAQHWKVLDPHR